MAAESPALDAGETDRAAYWAFFHGYRLLAINEPGRATAWMQRAQRLAEQLGADAAVRGYLLLPLIRRRFKEGDLGAAQKLAAEAVAIGERCGEADLVAFARCHLGRAIVRQGVVENGVAQLDEAMLAATARELTPVITGLVYCSVIATCRQVFAFERAREWTAALGRWCDGQPQLVQFNGLCRIHRAEIMELNGAWPQAVLEARHAKQHVARASDRETKAAAAYQEGEIHRLRGEPVAAEESYKEASRWGQEPQPGLALLRLAQGRTEQAAAAVRRCLAALHDPLARARPLPAAVEIFIAAQALDEARAASAELAQTAGRFATDVLNAISAQAAGAVELAADRPAPARFCGLDGMRFPAPTGYFPTKDEMGDFLLAYAQKFALPVRTGVRVDAVRREGDRYVVEAGAARFEARHVVIAAASYQQPKMPAFAAALDPSIRQIHSKEYKNPAQLKPGTVLLVGAANSGGEIAMDLVKTHTVLLAGRHPGEVPLRMHTWFATRLVAPIIFRIIFHRLLSLDTPMGRKARPTFFAHGAPLIRVKARDLVAAGVRRVGRIGGVRNGRPVLEDGSAVATENVIWCTGFRHGLDWVKRPIFDEAGRPRQQRGVIEGEPGLYIVGLSFQHAPSSTMIHGVGRDARRVAETIAQRVRATPAPSRASA